MIDFQPITSITAEDYDRYLFAEQDRGCELSYGNLNMWGEQKVAILHDHLVLLSRYGNRYMYPFPMGDFNTVQPVLDAIIEDAQERQIPLSISSINEERAALLERFYPGKFDIAFPRDFFDYIYEIEKLATLKGRKYHRKRNHYHRFCKNHPDFRVEPITSTNISRIEDFVKVWYADKQEQTPDEDFHGEHISLLRAFENYERLRLDGILLLHDDNVLAFSIGSPLSSDTFDVHFEKARWDIEGAYTAINCEFAKYIHEKYPHIRYLDREEDMGVEGLRKAKESYFPYYMLPRGFAEMRMEKSQ